MANYDEPVSSGLQAAEAMKALAHATLKFGDKPEDTFSVLGDMLSITSSYVNVLHNLAAAHERNIDHAHDDHGRHRDAGRALALAAAQSLRRAAFQIADAYRHVDHATHMSSRIVWIPDGPATRTPDGPHRTNSRLGTVPDARELGDGTSVSRTLDHDGTRSEGRSL